MYFRPWTLAEKVATETVPYLAHLHRPGVPIGVSTPVSTAVAQGEAAIGSKRKAWKEYSQRLLPHAKAQLQKFIEAE